MPKYLAVVIVLLPLTLFGLCALTTPDYPEYNCSEVVEKIEVPTPKILPGYPACVDDISVFEATAPYESSTCFNTVDLVYYDFLILSTSNTHFIRVYIEDDQTADIHVPLEAVHYP